MAIGTGASLLQGVDSTAVFSIFSTGIKQFATNG
jgi:hypothetical protein